MNEEEMNVVDKMAKYGGSFVKALAEVFYRADRSNFYKLKNAFPEYWEEYKNFPKQNE